MRTLALFLVALILSGCASSPKQKCSDRGGSSPRPSMFERLGFKRPGGEEAKPASTVSDVPVTFVPTGPARVEPGPTLSIESPLPQ